MPKVLIVDLMPHIDSIVYKVLEKLKIEYLFIDRFESVPYILSIHHFDAIIIDPVYNKGFFKRVKIEEGFNLVKHIKEKFKKLPVILHSAFRDLDNNFERSGVLVDGYAIKSDIDGSELANELIRFFEIVDEVYKPSIDKPIRIFISYAKEDISKAYAIYDILKQKRYSPWIDSEHILPGQNWELAIEKAIEDSQFFLALLSFNSVSKEGFYQRELKKGLELLDRKPEGTIYLLPVRLEDCKLPDRFKKIHWCNVFESNGLNLDVRNEDLLILKITRFDNQKLQFADNRENQACDRFIWLTWSCTSSQKPAAFGPGDDRR